MRTGRHIGVLWNDGRYCYMLNYIPFALAKALALGEAYLRREGTSDIVFQPALTFILNFPETTSVSYFAMSLHFLSVPANLNRCRSVPVFCSEAKIFN